MGANGPPKTPQHGPPEAGPAANHEDTQPISRLALDAAEADAEAGLGPDPTDTMTRGSLPFGRASSSPDTEPMMRVAQAIDLEVRRSDLHAQTMAPVRAAYGIDDVREQFARGDFDAAYAIAEAILAYDSSNAEARSYATSCELRLRRRYAARLGSMRRVPRVIATDAASLGLDERTRALLACIDGRVTTEALLRASGLGEMDALRLFVSLLDAGHVTLD